MLNSKFSILDAVALAMAAPEHGLVKGQVGTIVGELAPSVFEVEFCDDTGATYGMAVFPDEWLMVLHYGPVAA